MSQSYPFTISTAFPNGKVNNTVLRDQIMESSIATLLEGILCQADTCTVTFEAALSGGDETTLNALVAAHQGDPYSAFPLIATNDPEEQASSIAPLDKVTINVHLPAGKYDINWSCDLKSSSNSKEVYVNIAMNGTVIRQSVKAARKDGWTPVFGIAPMTLTVATSITIKLQYGCTVEGMAAHIRDGFLEIIERT